jgi:4-amino-4-deoxy-L-arabinose transferase-like glycosyltransferase
VLLWTFGPYVARPSLPHDTLEGITWGLQWQWGYNKHPFLTAWLAAGAAKLLGNGDWPIYLLAQSAVAFTFIAVWQLAKKMLPALHALIATLILDGVLFYNINSFNFTSDTLQSPLWALLSLFFYQALVSQKIYYWLLTGLFTALCICTKYQVIVLLLPMLFLCLWNPTARASFIKPGIYCALFLFFLLISPHVVWLYQHDFITFTYARNSATEYTETKTIFGIVLYPLLALANQIFNISGIFILLWPFYTKDKGPELINSFQWQFLISLGFGPTLLSFLLCMLIGDYFPPRWSTPYFFLIGIMSIAYLKPKLSRKQIMQWTISIVLFSFLLFSVRMASLTFFRRADSDAFFPNKEMALSLSKIWHQHYQVPLSYLAGSNYLVAMLTPYITDHPKPYLSWVENENPWINEAKLRKKGALFIWDEGQNYAWDKDSRENTHLPQSIVQRFPELKILPNAIFYRKSDNYPIIIGIGLLPPH